MGDIALSLQSSIGKVMAKNARQRFDPSSVTYELERPDTAK